MKREREREIFDNETTGLGAEKRSGERERRDESLISSWRGDTAHRQGRHPPPPCSSPRRIFSSVTWKRTRDTDLPEFYVSKRVIVLVAAAFSRPSRPIFHTQHSAANIQPGESVGDTRRRRIFPASRLGSAKWIRLPSGLASSGLPKRHSPPLTFRFAFSSPPFPPPVSLLRLGIQDRYTMAAVITV